MFLLRRGDIQFNARQEFGQNPGEEDSGEKSPFGPEGRTMRWALAEVEQGERSATIWLAIAFSGRAVAFVPGEDVTRIEGDFREHPWEFRMVGSTGRRNRPEAWGSG